MGNCFPVAHRTQPISDRNIISQEDTFYNTMTAYKENTTIVNSTANTDREFHKEESSTYWLPKDEEEQMRLTGQHYAFKSLFEGNMLPSVTDVLDFQKGINILDVGCGSGVWIMDMVQEYPNCTYYGCDIADTRDKSMDVNQYTFSKGNVANKLPYEDNTFDFVHMRFLVLALREDEWPAAIKELIRVTKPGGMIQLVDFELHMPKDPSNYFYKVMSATKEICESRGQNPYIGAELNDMLSKQDSVKVVQYESKDCDMSSGTPPAKMFVWSAVQAFKSTQPVLGPMLGINTSEQLDEFLKEYKHSLETKESIYRFHCVAAHKL